MLRERISGSIKKLELDLKGRRILTEAATGNYVVTPVIAASAGAEVMAYTRDSAYGTAATVKNQTAALADEMNVSSRLRIITDIAGIDLRCFDIVTNCGFLRPIDRDFISRLSPGSVIPLMYEPWEFRDGEIDLEACLERGIKVYGTNEADPRLRIMEYIGYAALYFLLARKLSPFSANILVLGCEQFVGPTIAVLERNGYAFRPVTAYDERVDVSGFNAVVVVEFADDRLLIGPGSSAYINLNDINPEAYVIHIAGNVNFTGAAFAFTPDKPRPFRYMSYTTDFIDPQAVIDLHTAGLKVGEGLLAANRLGLRGGAYKHFMETNYPALAFDNERLW